MLRPTPGDPWEVEQNHWNTGAEENQQLNPGGPSNRQKKLRPKPTNINSFMSGPSLSLTPDPGNIHIISVNNVVVNETNTNLTSATAHVGIKDK